MIEVVRALTTADFAAAGALFREYARSLNRSADWTRSVEKEGESLPGSFGPPHGGILLARVGSESAGCVGVRRVDDHDCEMKRMYVRPAFRGQGIGRAIAIAAVEEARKLGYSRMRLSTMPHLHAAIALYQSMGFQVGEPYPDDGETCAIYMELALASE